MSCRCRNACDACRGATRIAHHGKGDQMNRKDFLTSLAGLAVGVPAGAVGTMHVLEPKPRSESESCPRHGRISYSQAGEDMITAFFFDHFKIKEITYLDIGTWDPILINNTYYFYEHGHQGVLV